MANVDRREMIRRGIALAGFALLNGCTPPDGSTFTKAKSESTVVFPLPAAVESPTPPLPSALASPSPVVLRDSSLLQEVADGIGAARLSHWRSELKNNGFDIRVDDYGLDKDGLGGAYGRVVSSLGVNRRELPRRNSGMSFPTLGDGEGIRWRFAFYISQVGFREEWIVGRIGSPLALPQYAAKYFREELIVLDEAKNTVRSHPW